MQRAVVGKSAPKFQVEAVLEEDFLDIGLEDYRGKYVILLFYVRDFTPICLSEVKAFSDAFDEFSKLNCQLLAISTDSKYTHLAWNGTGPGAAADNARGLKMPLLADHDHLISRHYGVLQSEGHAQRATFIIDTNEMVRHASFCDSKIGRSVDETFRLLKAIQHVDKNGEECPANWTP